MMQMQMQMAQGGQAGQFPSLGLNPQLGTPPPPAAPVPPASTAGVPPSTTPQQPDFNAFASMLQGMQRMGMQPGLTPGVDAPAPAAPPQDPLIQYATQIAQLNDMGFFDP